MEVTDRSIVFVMRRGELKTKLLVIAFIAFRLNLMAQTSPDVKIIDLIVSPATEIDTSTDEITQFLVEFKINKPNLSDKAYIFLGTAHNQSNILEKQARFVSRNNTYFLEMDGVEERINEYVVRTFLQWRTSSSAKTSITVFVKDKNGLETNHLYLDY